MAEPSEESVNVLESPEVKAAIAAAVARETEGLIKNRDKILAEQVDLKEKLSKYKDIDPEKAKDILTRINQSEDAQMIADGKLDDLIEKRTSSIREESERAVAELMEKLNDVSGKYESVSQRYSQAQINATLRDAATKAGVRPEAIDDVLLRGRSVFTLADDGSLEARDAKGELIKDEEGLILDPARYISKLKKSAPHYWADSSGSGITGQGGSASDLQSRIDAAAAAGNMDLYRKLRSQKAAK